MCSAFSHHLVTNFNIHCVGGWVWTGGEVKGGEWVYMGVGEAPDSSRWERSPAVWHCVRTPPTTAVAPRTSVGAFQVGQLATGRVINIEPFAIYVDIGCTNKANWLPRLTFPSKPR